MSESTKTLRIQRIVAASPERVFRAWTDPEELKQWWGPAGVICRSASVDLCIGGRYRIENEFPDGSVLWITGTFEFIEAPEKLVYSWSIEGAAADPERVTVLLKEAVDGTEITIIHDRIATAEVYKQHQRGWDGCLDGLASHSAGPTRR